MKTIKYLGALLFIVLILFLSLGLFVSSFEYSADVAIQAPIEKCWAVFNDTSRMKNWIPGFERITLLEGEAAKPGAVYEVVIRQDELYIMQERVREMTAPQLASFELTNDVMRLEYEYRFSATASGTNITSHYTVHGTNLIWKSILFISKSYLQTAASNQLDQLKIEIELGELEFD